MSNNQTELQSLSALLQYRKSTLSQVNVTNQPSNDASDCFSIDYDNMYEVAVISTVSSGKSTLINALTGTRLLPSMNAACTFRTVSIIDIDNNTTTTCHLIDANGKVKTISNCNPEIISPYLSDPDENIKDIWIEHPIEGIRNVTKALLLTDTPGVNNSLDSSHENITLNYFHQMKKGTILMVLNATALGTYDEKQLLDIIINAQKEKPNIKVVFVLNKCDELDTANEPLSMLMNNCTNYLKKCGFENPTIYPISAIAALLFRQVLTGQKLSHRDTIQFKKQYSFFKTQGNDLAAYIVNSGEMDNKRITIDRSTYMVRKIKEAIFNTGIPELENAIEKQIIDSLGETKIKIRS